MSAAAADVFGDFTYVDNGTTITITDYPTNATGAVEIPTTIYDSMTGLYDPVKTIGANAFSGCNKLTSVTIPIGVTSIENSAFYFCSALTTVNLPDGVTSLGAAAFASCTALANVAIPSSVTSLGNSAFANCAALPSVEIPSGITIIGTSVFNGCSGLTSVTIPSSVTTIWNSAFQYCSALTSVVIPPSVTTLGSKAFASCKGLTSITIPQSVTTISTEVFASCSSLTSIEVDATNLNFSSLNGVLFNKLQTRLITFPPGLAGGYEVPGTVTKIEIKAFIACDKLVGVTFPPGLINIATSSFSTCSNLLYANFTGDAPTSYATNAFDAPSPGFAIYHMDAAALTFAVWPWTESLHPRVNMGENNTPSTAWLLSKGLPANTDIQSDSNGDGVKLLMARALNLDPHRNLSGEMPRPVVAGSQMSLSFYAAAAGITYRVKTSENLTDWTTEVPYSEPDANQISTATVNISGPARYMRLEVSN